MCDLASGDSGVLDDVGLINCGEVMRDAALALGGDYNSISIVPLDSTEQVRLTTAC